MSDPGSIRLPGAGQRVRAAWILALALVGASSARGPAAADDDVVARRAAAERLAERGDLAELGAFLGEADDPDATVRAAWARALGAVRHGDARADERVARLAGWAADDPDAEVRRAAIEALGESALPGAADALDRLLGEVDDVELAPTAEALASSPGGRDAVVRRVRDAFDGHRVLASEALAPLLAAYGDALADQPRGGEVAAERAPFALARAHPVAAVRRAGAEGLQALFDRLEALAEYARTDRVLAGFQADGVLPLEMLYRRAFLALARLGDAQAALAHADALIGSPLWTGDSDDRTWPAYGWHFRGAALFALGRFAEADASFERAGALLGALSAEREDLRPDLFRPRNRYPQAPAGGAVLVERLRLVALEELWRALCVVAAEPDEAAWSRALASARQAHEHQLRAELFALRTDAGASVASWDALFLDDLAPARLLLAGRGEATVRLDDALAWQAILGRLAATVAPGEVPGFAPAEVDLPWLDPFADDARFGLLVEAELEELEQASRDWDTTQQRLADRAAAGGGLLEPNEIRNHPKLLRELTLRRRLLDRERSLDGRDLADPAVRREVFEGLRQMRLPSRLGLRLAQRLRAEGRAGDARALARRALTDLEQDVLGAGPLWLERSRAELELVVGSSYTDEGEPERAEEALAGAVARLEALENTLVERRRTVGSDPELLRTYDAWLEETRRMRGTALTSLAVNANVRLKQPEKALGYFERAFELDPSDFNRVLLACYRARSGRAAEARTILASVPLEPAHYYNLACTHALLGEPDLALDFLRREFSENHTGPESLARQKEWARSDPDLASLRPLAAFQRLVHAD